MKRKILTILGTRPEIIRLSRIIPKLDAAADHRILHTGQNYDATLNDIFFKQLNLRRPDCILESRGSIGEQLATMFVGVEKYLDEFKPDAVLILGDTNSGLAAIVCERKGIPVFHMEAGNRCYDLSVPEEKNRKLIDSVSSINLPYTNLSRENLLREGHANNKILVTGNPILEVIEYYKNDIEKQARFHSAPYIVATAHRAENVDNPQRLKNIVDALNRIADEYPIVFSCHPRTRQKLQGLTINKNIQVIEPVGFFEWVALERNSVMAISDSGTVQEEMCLFKRPTITIRQTTERPETVWCGSNIVSGLETDRIIESFWQARRCSNTWQPPEEYTRLNVSDTVVNILMSNYV